VDDGNRPGLFIEQRIMGGTIMVVELGGYLDVEAMPRLAMCTDDICSTTLRHVQVEMGGLTSLDDAGFRILGTFCQLLRRQGCSLILVGPRPLVQNLLNQFWLAPSGTEDEYPARDTAPRPGGSARPLTPVQQCELLVLERDLCAQEPALAAMFAAYGRLVDD
jgi:anti-anti-sigma factor